MLKPQQIDVYLFRIAEHAIEGNIHHEVVMARLQKEIVTQALELEGGNMTRTARRLGIHRNSLIRWLTRFDLYAAKFKKPPRRAA